ncbi:MAG TPA: hypothetical protein VFT91_11290 [Dehalococcoidia bacterium]|nr:hypothetical protein [Dehalococcoidia bacterium]
MSRRRARGRTRRQRGLPDWVWGVTLGVVVLAGVGVFLLITGSVGGGGGSACDRPLKPLGEPGESDLSAQGFAAEDAGLTKVISLLNAGRKDDAESAFYGPVHNFTHNADPSIREKDAKLAKELCKAVINIEDHLAFGADFVQLSGDAQRIRDLLRDGAAALGYPRPQ